MILYDSHVHLADDAAPLVAEEMRIEGATKWSVLSCSQYDDDPVQNLAALYAKALRPEVCFAYCGFVYPKKEKPDFLRQLRLWLDAGFDGLKFLETKPDCAKATGARLDTDAYEPVFDYCEKNGVPVTWHVGDPAAFWDAEKCPQNAKEAGWAYLDGSFLTLEELYAMTERVLERHPLLKVAFAHFYFVSDDPGHAARMMERFPNLRFDLTPGVEMYGGFSANPDFYRPFIQRYAHRIQFGSDAEIGRYAEYRGGAARTEQNVERFFRTTDVFDASGWQVKGFGYPEDVLEKLFAQSNAAFVGERPKPIDREAALMACRETLEMMRREGDARLPLAEEIVSRIEALV